MSIKGYKVFNPDWTCRGFQYEVGKTFKHKGNIEMCGRGFHFCQKLSDCFNYYSFDINNKVAEVEAIGNTETRNDKSVTDEIKIIKELNWHEVLDLCNSGNCNSGNSNSGNCNSGDWNSGNRNSGNRNSGNRNSGGWNSGNRNSGNSNSGDWNSGNRNSGDRNSGDWNSGNRNSGNRNSGDWNSGDRNSGFFNSSNELCFAFNKILNDRNSFIRSKGYTILNWNYENNWWIYSKNMTDTEKVEHPEHETTGGYLKTIPFKDACALMWDKLDDDEKKAVTEMPNFDADVFEEVTGIKAKML